MTSAKCFEEKISSKSCAAFIVGVLFAVSFVYKNGCVEIPPMLFYLIISIGLPLLGFHVIASTYELTVKAMLFSSIFVAYAYINTYIMAASPRFVDPYALDKLCDGQRNFVMFSVSLFSFIISMFAIIYSTGEMAHDKKKDKTYTVDVFKENSNKVSVYTITIKGQMPQSNSYTKTLKINPHENCGAVRLRKRKIPFRSKKSQQSLCLVKRGLWFGG